MTATAMTVAPVRVYAPTRMPELYRFCGIVIKMYVGDHSPPHFHAQLLAPTGSCWTGCVSPIRPYGSFLLSIKI